MKRISKFIGKPQSILFGFFSVTFFTLISKILGLGREIVLASSFGTSWHLDCVIVAMEPTIQIGMIITTALSTVMLPIYIDKKIKDPEKVKSYGTSILFASILSLTVFGALLFFFNKEIAMIFAPKFSTEKLTYTAKIILYLSPMPIFIGLNTIMGTILRAERSFFQQAIVQVIFNIITIPLIIFFSPSLGETGYALSWFLGTVSMTIVFFFLTKKHISFHIDKNIFFGKDIKETYKLSLPLFLGNGIGSVNQIVDKAFASSLATGSISSLRYSQNLLTMFNSVFVSSFFTTAYTKISEMAVKSDFINLEFLLKNICKKSLNVIVPITFWIILTADRLIQLLFQRGDFNDNSTSMVSVALISYILIILTTPYYTLSANVLVILKKTKLLTIVSVTSLLLNTLLDYIFLGFGHTGIALSTTFVSFICTIIILIILQRKTRINIFDFKVFLNSLFIPLLILLFSLLTKQYIDELLWLSLVTSAYIFIFVKNNLYLLKSIIYKLKRRRK